MGDFVFQREIVVLVVTTEVVDIAAIGSACYIILTVIVAEIQLWAAYDLKQRLLFLKTIHCTSNGTKNIISLKREKHI